MSTALFIGRFQPLHNGHLQIIKEILKQHDHIIIGVGSSQEKDTKLNPLSAQTRVKLIKEALKTEGIIRKQYSIILLPDIHDQKNWAAYVNGLVPEFDTLYTGSDFTKKCYNNAGKKIIDIPRIKNISATDIRERIINNDPTWKTLVPQPIVNALKDITIPPHD